MNVLHMMWAADEGGPPSSAAATVADLHVSYILQCSHTLHVRPRGHVFPSLLPVRLPQFCPFWINFVLYRETVH